MYVKKQEELKPSPEFGHSNYDLLRGAAGKGNSKKLDIFNDSSGEHGTLQKMAKSTLNLLQRILLGGCIGCALSIFCYFSLLPVPIHGNESAVGEEPDFPVQKSVINVVLVGATGDLAQKYLYSSFFRIYLESEFDIYFFAGAREAVSKGKQTLANIFANRIPCGDDTHCFQAYTAYSLRWQYVMLKGPDAYRELDSAIRDRLQSQKLVERGRLFYLSIPPSAFGSVADNIGRDARPIPGGWLRVILEKPFGTDLASAHALRERLEQSGLAWGEMHFVDHYLGKELVRAILHFRMLNRDILDPLWNHAFVDRVEIVMKEKESVSGRTSFYEGVGVVRDVFQNHLTQVMAMVGMELPGTVSREAVRTAKEQFLRQVVPAKVANGVQGQYDGYATEVEAGMPTPE
ncbi:hypothetical protein CYMTET_35369, partial [Cymbomonas tetramitiformis]